MIPRIAHFVFGLQEQVEPFHFLHYASLESCRRVLEPEAIYFHHKHRPWGAWWERIQPHLTVVEIDHVPNVLAADYSGGYVPGNYRYAHHSDFLRLDALIAHGGIYADIDTIFVREFPPHLFEAPFVIGAEPPVRDERSGEWRPSLCNALLMAPPGAPFARVWRDEMAAALDGTWSNHSGSLSHQLSVRMPSAVRLEPSETFFPFPATPAGLSMLLEQRCAMPAAALSVHLWAHLWWDRRRRDFSLSHGGRYLPSFVRCAQTTLAEITRSYLPSPPTARAAGRPRGSPERAARWSYFSLDEDSGYGVAAKRCVAALEDSGVEVSWMPMVAGNGWGLFYEPARGAGVSVDEDHPVIAHVVAEYLPAIRARAGNAFLVAHTVWDTDRLPADWVGCLDVADLVVVPSRFSAEVFERSPVVAPVEIVPHVAPPALPSTSDSWPDVAEDVLMFYTVAEWNERKAVFHTIEAYLRAFTSRDRVLLVVKTSPWDFSFRGDRTTHPAGEGTTARLLARLLAAHRDPPPVRLIARELATHEIAALHRRGDCFVSLARCEGWGLGAFDAAAHGNPVVTTGYGGQLDFLADCPYLVSYELIPVEFPAGLPVYSSDQRWAEPDLDHAAALLRVVAAEPRHAVELAQPIAADIRWRYRPAAIAPALRAAVEHHAEVPRRDRRSTPARFSA